MNRRLFDTFWVLAMIPSSSFHEGGILEHIKSLLENMGVETIFFDNIGSEIGSDAPGNLFAFIPSTTKSKNSLLFCAHADTVLPVNRKIKLIEDDIKFYSNGETILGADDLSGVSILLEIAKVIKNENIAHGGIWLLFTIGEEEGSSGLVNADLSLIRQYDPNFANMGIVYDWEQPNHIVYGGIGKLKLYIEVSGFYSRNPNECISALLIANKALSLLPIGLIYDNPQTTVNVSHFSSGLTAKTNKIPDKAVIEIEIRSQEQEIINYLSKQVNIAFKSSVNYYCLSAEGKMIKGSYKIDIMDGSYKRWKVAKNHFLVKVIKKAIKKNSLAPLCIDATGGSDGDILNANGISSIGLGCGMRNPHSKNEILLKGEFLKAVDIGVDIVIFFNQVN